MSKRTKNDKKYTKTSLEGEALQRYLNGMSRSAKFTDKKKKANKYACRGKYAA